MGRKPRLEYPGGIYHLIQRGNNREYIFNKTEDKEFLLDLIKEYRDVMGFDLYGYVIMSNHYHLIIRISQAPLKDIMHRINNKFSRYFNIKYKRTGHVFENRYKGILVIDDRYLLSLLRYIHQNPVIAKMCNRVEDYTWGSDKFYRFNNVEGMVDIDFILDIFSSDRVKALKSYVDFMSEEKREDMDFFENCNVIGNVSTYQLDKYLKSDIKSLDEILESVVMDSKIIKEIKHGSRKRYLSQYKKEFIEDQKVTISRVKQTNTYPASFMLVAAMNPCPCGYYGNDSCKCSDYEVLKYRQKISGPIMDRMDIQKYVRAVDFISLANHSFGKSSKELRERVEFARAIQNKRFKEIPKVNCNAQMNNALIKEYCQLEGEGQKLLQMAYDRFNYSARTFHKFLKVARTFADMDASEKIRKKDIAAALMSRDLEKDRSIMAVL